jgi:uncharacterized protein (DUF2252 family)
VRHPLALLLLAGCAGDADGRRGWLVDLLVDDNAPWYTRDTSLLATKYDRMDERLYDFMRGTLTLYLADVSRPGTDRTRTSVLTDPNSASVLLLADPHPENVGVFWPEGEPRLDFNDLDGVAHGPWTLDLRRAALGLGTLVWDQPRCDDACRADIVLALVAGYRSGIAGEAPVEDGRAVQRLLDEASEEGDARKRFRENTTGTSAGRRFLRDDALDATGRGHLDPTDDEAQQIRVLADQLAARLPGFRLHDAVRRYGRGIASLPARRYLLLYDFGEDGSADDRILEAREAVDTAALPGLLAPVPGLLDDPVARIEQSSRYVWATDNDPMRLGLADGAMTFRTASWSSYLQGFDHEKIAEDLADRQTSPASLRRLADRIGHLLGSAHVRGPSAAGLSSAEVLAAELADADGLEAEVLATAEDDLARLVRDHQLFQSALDDLGPLLGAERVYPELSE